MCASPSPCVARAGSRRVADKPFACPAGTQKDGHVLDPAPADVVLAAEALTPLAAVPDQDPRWEQLAVPTLWPADRALQHITDALLYYAGHVARRADRRLPPLRTESFAPPSELLDNVLTAAHVLAGLLRDLGTGRAWHPSGQADAAGWTGMAVTEILVHGYDTATALGVTLPLPAQVCARTVARVFPWMPTGTVAGTVAGTGAGMVAADQLLLAITCRVHLDGLACDPHWWWQSAPLSEWDGQPRRRTARCSQQPA